MGAGRLRIPGSLQEHDPAGGRAAAAVLVLRAALAAVPVLPPDPLEVVHLEHEEGDDPEENLRFRHDPTRIGTQMGRINGPSGLFPGPRGPNGAAWGAAVTTPPFPGRPG